MGAFYWQRHPGGPFATLIRVAATYLHPEADDLESLQRLAGRENDAEMRVFKAELREALREPGRLPRGALPAHVRYDDGSPEAFLRRLWRDLYGDEPPGAPPGLLDPDREFGQLDTDELLAMVPRASEPAARRGRAMMELGRRASSDVALLPHVAVLIRDPRNRRLITVGTVSVSRLGTAGLVAGGGEPAGALARELAGEWTPGEQSDLAWLMSGSPAPWPGEG